MRLIKEVDVSDQKIMMDILYKIKNVTKSMGFDQWTISIIHIYYIRIYLKYYKSFSIINFFLI